MIGLQELCHQKTSLFAKNDNNDSVAQGESE